MMQLRPGFFALEIFIGQLNEGLYIHTLIILRNTNTYRRFQVMYV